jgi:hypothetical protein
MEIPALKAKREDYKARMEAYRQSRGMGNQPAPDLEVEGATYAKGGTVKSKSMNMGGMAGYKKGGMAGYKSGGSCGSGMKKYARGGGVESHGKTKGTMIKMASGGSVSSRADGIASKGKTNCKIC